MTEVMTQAEEILDRVLMIETEEGILHSEADLVVTITQECHIDDRIITEMEVTLYNKGSEVNPDHQLEDLELHQGLPVEIYTDVSGCK